jgi:cell division transport system permease protein
MRWRFFLSEALHSVRGNAATTMAATLTVLIVTFLLGVTMPVGHWLWTYTQGVRGEIVVKAYTNDAVANNPTKLGLLQNQLTAMRYVKKVVYISPAQALKQAGKTEQQEIKDLGFNPLPPTFELYPTNPNEAGAVQSEALKVSQIANCGSSPCVDYQKRLTNQVLRTTWVILAFVAGLMVLLGVAAVVLITNTIRLSIFSRRREIEVMKLVGANNSFVRMPFVLEGMLTGLMGSVAAVILLGVAYIGLSDWSRGLTDPARSFPAGVPALIAVLALFGLLLGGASSSLTVRRFLRV